MKSAAPFLPFGTHQRVLARTSWRACSKSSGGLPFPPSPATFLLQQRGWRLQKKCRHVVTHLHTRYSCIPRQPARMQRTHRAVLPALRGTPAAGAVDAKPALWGDLLRRACSIHRIPPAARQRRGLLDRRDDAPRCGWRDPSLPPPRAPPAWRLRAAAADWGWSEGRVGGEGEAERAGRGGGMGWGRREHSWKRREKIHMSTLVGIP